MRVLYETPVKELQWPGASLPSADVPSGLPVPGPSGLLTSDVPFGLSVCGPSGWLTFAGLPSSWRRRRSVVSRSISGPEWLDWLSNSVSDSGFVVPLTECAPRSATGNLRVDARYTSPGASGHRGGPWSIFNSAHILTQVPASRSFLKKMSKLK